MDAHRAEYRWFAASHQGGAHTDAGFTGVVSDPTAAEPTFTCELVGETEVILLVSDGECSAVEYVPINQRRIDERENTAVFWHLDREAFAR